MTGTFDNLFVFKEVEPTPEVGAGSRDNKRFILACKKNEITFSVVSAEGKWRRNSDISGFRFNGVSEKTKKGGDEQERKKDPSPL